MLAGISRYWSHWSRGRHRIVMSQTMFHKNFLQKLFIFDIMILKSITGAVSNSSISKEETVQLQKQW